MDGRGKQGRVMVSGALGFCTGIAFWHMVGFWGFVNEAVYHRNASDAAPLPLARTAFLKAQSRQTGQADTISARADTCSQAALRDDAASRVGACGLAAVKFLPSRGIGRADFADFGEDPASTLINGANPAPPVGAPAVSGWSAAIAPSSPKP